MELNKPIILIGMMGGGKTTIGRHLAARLSFEFYDSDRLIEAAEGQSVTNIFQEKGEAYFRACESRTILPLLSKKNSVLACGGGSITVPEIAEAVFSSGFVICITAPLDILVQRLSGGKDRPLLQGRDLKVALSEKLEERKNLYKRAHLEVDTSRHASQDAVVDHILHLISIYKVTSS